MCDGGQLQEASSAGRFALTRARVGNDFLGRGEEIGMGGIADHDDFAFSWGSAVTDIVPTHLVLHVICHQVVGDTIKERVGRKPLYCNRLLMNK